MANLSSRTYCNIFWTFLERPQIRPKNDPRTPYLLQKYFKNIRKYEHLLKRYHLWDYGDLKNENEKPCTDIFEIKK